jgi:putative transcriptional regulator
MSNVAINHHPSAELLLSYSAGSVSSSQAICIATHLDYCTSCRAAHQRNNAIGGVMLQEGKAGGVSAESKKKVLAAIAARKASNDNPLAELEAVAAAPLTSAEVPRPLRKIIPEGFSALRWRLATMSVRTCNLNKESDGASISLLKIKAGGKVNRHTHMGDEYTVVLKGSFSDEDGLYRPGDFLVRSPDEQHTPVATTDSDCICLSAQEAPLQFTGGIWRLMNPMLRKSFYSA